jgi:phosphate transport system permease protein
MLINMNNKWNIWKDKLFEVFAIACTLASLFALALLLYTIISKGLSHVNWTFLSSLPSRHVEKTGIYTAIAGMLSVLFMTILIAFPIGIGAGIYLEEFVNKKNRYANILETNIINLAGVPSIIYGIIGLEIFVRLCGFGNSVLAGAFTLSLLVLPIVIVATREAIKSVPTSLREASLAMGATTWQTIKNIILPSAYGGILTGMILSISRTIGETAPLIVVGALIYVPFLPEGLMDQYTVLPIQIFNWISRPQQSYISLAAAGIIILLGITFLLNGLAIILRNRWYKRMQ